MIPHKPTSMLSPDGRGAGRRRHEYRRYRRLGGRGVEALYQLLNLLPADLPAALIVAIHRDPEKPSHLREIM